MLLDLTPVRKYRDYRLLLFGQIISTMGTMMSYVAVPYQMYELTHDNAMVGLIGIVQLLPVLVCGILGGTLADRINRRRLLLTSEAILCALVSLLVLNAWQEKPSVAILFILVALAQGVFGFHRPAMDALVQSIVDKKHYSAVGALGALRYSFGAIAGPALAGVIIAAWGVKGAFLADAFSFFAAFISLLLMSKIPDPKKSTRSAWADAKEGMAFAVSRPELIGTYVIDIVAMIFAFPVALYPAMSENWGGARAAGILFSAMAVGSLAITLFSGWTAKIVHRGRGVVISASLWAVFMIGVGFAGNLWVAFAFLALAGAADMLSALFRSVIWNESIPNALRGRLSGIEMISYLTGPLLGNARAGWVAAKVSVPFSLYSGGILCFVGVILTACLLPSFWRYESPSLTKAPAPA